jgi:hypothetical protein
VIGRMTRNPAVNRLANSATSFYGSQVGYLDTLGVTEQISR